MMLTTIAIRAYAAIVDALAWAWGHKRLSAELAMAVVILIGGWRYNRQQAAAAAVAAKQAGLAAGLSEQIRLINGQLDIAKRQPDGKIVYKQIYVPEEGSVVISQKDESALRAQIQDLTNKLTAAVSSGDRRAADDIRNQIDHIGSDVDVKVTDHGLTLRPGYGLDWANHGIQARLDVKAYYWKRYSLLLGGSTNGVGLGISRHLDDIIWGHPQNVEFFAGYDFFRLRPSDAPVVIGIRSNF